MDKSKLVQLLVDLNANNSDSGENQQDALKQKLDASRTLMSSTDFTKSTFFMDSIFQNKNNALEWKYIQLNFHILETLNHALSNSNTDLLSVQETKNVKIALQNLMLVAISKNIQPNLPYHVVEKNSVLDEKITEDILYKYNVLKSTVIALHRCIKCPNLRMLILPQCLGGMLVATFQIAYCPLKKPENNRENKGFNMTEETYAELLNDQKTFKEILDDMSKKIHPTIFIKETMILFQKNAPLWFKKAVSNLLTKLMMSDKGIQNVASAMLDGTDNDTTTTWKIIDILTKLILSCRKSPDFKEKVCPQVLDLLRLVRTTDHELLVFERLVVSCAKSLQSEDKELCKTVFLDRIMTPLSKFAYKEHKFREGDDVTDDVKQTVRLIHGCFVNSPSLPMHLLKTVIKVVFILYHLTLKSRLQIMNKELGDILIKYLQSCSNVYQLLDNILFGFTVKEIPQFRNDVILEINDKIVVKNSPHCIIYATPDVMDTVLKLFPTDQKILLFGYLLKCIADKEKYFPTSQTSKELLNVETRAADTVLERLLSVHHLLSELTEDKEVQRSLRNKPDDIIEYISNVLITDTGDHQVIFIVVMILDNLIQNSSPGAFPQYKILFDPLTSIAEKTTNSELKSLCFKVTAKLKENKSFDGDFREQSDFQKALNDVCDPLLPTRGHALLVLSKLIERKDKEAVERKQYLLNLFQLHLKDEDSYIYLNAVRGLAALANLFGDTVLEILCEEYSDYSKKTEGSQETRMKLGEILVRVVKSLGDMAPKYKALLLNTFLSGTKDDDHLLRASSLSNLGEVCRVLNYKLGTIITEVLVCVHAIITTDKAVEARRAAVTVLRQLFVGLQSEMIAFLKEDILPVYRTLKEIYYNDRDDVMRLQAQLALEELNENMKSFVFPKPELHGEKKIVMLD